MTNAMLTLKKFALICLYIILNYQCSINAAAIKGENHDLNKNHILVLPIYQKVTGDTLREYPILGYKIKKCLTHHYKKFKKSKKHIEDSKEIGGVPKKDSYKIKITNKHDSNKTSQFLKDPKGKEIDIKSEEMEMSGQTSNSSAENLFNAVIVGEAISVESDEDQELFDGIIIGESDEEDNETTFRPIMKYSETAKSDRRMGQFHSDAQPEEITHNITVFADENNGNEMVANVLEKLLMEIDLDDFMKILINYKRTHSDELTFNKLKEILSNRKGSATRKLPCISKELARKFSELGNKRLPYIYFDMASENANY